MKKRIILAAVALAVLTVMSARPARAGEDNKTDFQAIQKAVKKNPNYEPGKEAQWFKVLIIDTKTGQEKVKVTLPIGVIEALVACSGDKHIHMDDPKCDVDFKTLLQELKKAGPMALIEIVDEGEMIKVWLE